MFNVKTYKKAMFEVDNRTTFYEDGSFKTENIHRD